MPRLPEAFRIHYDVQYVGRMVKAAKRKITFKFAFEGDDDEHAVTLVHTLNSGKKVIFLNGSEIFREEKMSTSAFNYPFQVDGHLLNIIIEAQLSEAGRYDLQIDGRKFMDLQVTTLADLRTTSKEGIENLSAWSRGGAVNGAPSSAAIRAPANRGRPTNDDDVPVPSASLRDFVGSDNAKNDFADFGPPSNRSSSPGAPAVRQNNHATASFGQSGDWDPFSGGANKSSDFDAFGSSASLAKSSARRQSLTSSPPPAVPARPSVASTATGGLRPPPSTAGNRASVNLSAAAAKPAMPAPAPGPAPAVSSLADDLAGLSFLSAPAPAPVAASFSPFDAPVRMGGHEVQLSSGAAATAASDPLDFFGAPAPASTSSKPNITHDIFGGGLPTATNTGNLLGQSHVAASVATGESKGLVDLDDLLGTATTTATKRASITAGTVNNGKGLTLAQLAAQSHSGSSANTGMFGGPAVAPMMGMGPSMSSGMGNSGMGMMGGMNAMGNSSMGGMNAMGYGAMGAQMGGRPMSTNMGYPAASMFGAPAPANQASTEYNPFA